MTSRTFTPTAPFLLSFQKKYTASSENVLEEFYQHQSDESVLPRSVLDNSACSANRLTARVTSLTLAAQGSSSCFPFETARILMALPVFVFVFLLVVCLFLSLVLL
jgi:hypothetical protein